MRRNKVHRLRLLERERGKRADDRFAGAGIDDHGVAGTVENLNGFRARCVLEIVFQNVCLAQRHTGAGQMGPQSAARFMQNLTFHKQGSSQIGFKERRAAWRLSRRVKASQSFAPQGEIKRKSVLSGGFASRKNTSRLTSVEFARLWCTNYARSRGAFFLPGKRQLFRQLRRTAEAVLRGSSYSAAGASVSEASSTTAASCAARRASLISLASA